MWTALVISLTLGLLCLAVAIAVAVYAVNQAFMAEVAAEDITPPSDLPGPSGGHPDDGH